MPPEAEHCTVEGMTVRLKNFDGQYQALTTWCWAAASASIDHYYEGRKNLLPGERPQPAMRQCSMVYKLFGRKACRAGLHAALSPDDARDCHERGCAIEAGDESGRLDLALMGARQAPLGAPSRDFTRLFERSVPRPIGFRQIVEEINSGDPMAIRIERGHGTFHMLVIVGYNLAIPGLIMWDPSFGERLISYNQVQLRLGTWTHTIWTSDWLRNGAANFIKSLNVASGAKEAH